MLQVSVLELTPKLRAHCTKRSTGSRSLPKAGSLRPASERASTSSKTALTTAFKSPFTPLPLSLKTAATRAV